MQHAAHLAPAVLAEDVDGVGVGFARVYDDWQIQFACQPDLRTEDVLLHVAWREVVVVVESDFADGAGRRGRGELGPHGTRGTQGIIRELVCGVGMEPPIAKRTSGHSVSTRAACSASVASPAASTTSARSGPASRARATTAAKSALNVSSARWQ